MTVKNTYPLPLVPDIINLILDSKARYFTNPIQNWMYVGDTTMYESKRETSGKPLPNKLGPLQTPVMFFGLTNSLATFQTMMNDIFKDLINEGYVSVYMDDILVVEVPNP